MKHLSLTASNFIEKSIGLHILVKPSLFYLVQTTSPPIKVKQYNVNAVLK